MKPEVVIRPARLGDLDALFELAKLAGPGMTNFPADRDIIAQKLRWSEASFRKSVTEPGEEFYFFVLAHVSDDKPVGCCAIFARAGGEIPFYSYKVAKERLVSRDVELNHSIQTLYLLHDHDDTSEVATLFLSPDFRKNRNGAFLSRARLLFIKAFQQRFASKIIAEMRGVIDEEGNSPFWDSLGRHFFDMPFSEADGLCALGDKQFIVDVMPRCPIYVPILTKEAQQVIGEVHKNTRPARRLLEKEGFCFEGYVDIFDAGPTLEAKVHHIRTIAKSKESRVAILEASELGSSKTYMVSNTKLNQFAVGVVKAKWQQESNTLLLTAESAQCLSLTEGDAAQHIEFTK